MAYVMAKNNQQKVCITISTRLFATENRVRQRDGGGGGWGEGCSLAMIFGEGLLTIHSPPALFFFF